MMTSRFKLLSVLARSGKANAQMKLELEAEREKQEARFKVWRRQLGNFLIYVDFEKRVPELERVLFYWGFDPIDAGELILEAHLEYNSKAYICESS